jgi:hypothetical protein
MPKKSIVTNRHIEDKKAACFDKIILLLSFVLFLTAVDAHAYIDPGTGSYIIQLLIAGLLAAAYVLKMYWIKLIGLFRNLFLKSSKGKN